MIPEASMPSKNTTPSAPHHIHLTVHCDDQPVIGALVGTHMDWWHADPKQRPKHAEPGLTITLPDNAPPLHTDDVGQVMIAGDDIFYEGFPDDKAQGLVVIDGDTAYGAILSVHRSDLGSSIAVTLTPLCTVTGSIASDDLEQLGTKIGWTNVVASKGDASIAQSQSLKGCFTLCLPTGSYSLFAYGQRVDWGKASIRIRRGQRTKRMHIHLPAKRLEFLRHHQAPELTQIKAWSDQPLTISSLRGRVVLLYFWGHWCGPCVRNMPNVIDLHERYAQHGLTIIAIHDDSVAGFGELEQHCQEPQRRFWGQRELPFAVAIDGGGRCSLAQSSAPSCTGGRCTIAPERTTQGATHARYGITSHPTAILIDQAGSVVGEVDVYEQERTAARIASLLDCEQTKADAVRE